VVKRRLRTKVQRLRESSKKEDIDWEHVRKLWERLCESHKKKHENCLHLKASQR
jgi:hypothetical protein